VGKKSLFSGERQCPQCPYTVALHTSSGAHFQRFEFLSVNIIGAFAVGYMNIYIHISNYLPFHSTPSFV